MEPGRPKPPAASGSTVLVGLLLVLGAFVLYWLSNLPPHWNFYNHFVWQADAFLHGRAWIPFPVPASAELPGNAYFQDLYPISAPDGGPAGRVLIPFPPLPALVLLPFVAMAGLHADQEAVGIVLGATGVGLCFWMLGRLPVGLGVRALVTVLFAASSVWWWSSANATTWYFAHLVAVDLALLAVGVALRADPRSAQVEPGSDGADEAGDTGRRGRVRRVWAATFPLDRSQLLAGLLLGLAATARLPLVFGAPFLVLVGGGSSWRRRLVSAGVGAALPVGVLVAYTYLTTGSLLHPGYDYQYRLEAAGYPTLGYHPEWAVEDVRYIPQNLGIMLAALPAVLPDVLPNTLGYTPDVPVCIGPDDTRGLLDLGCPLAVPRDIGTSLLLTTPAFLLGLVPLARRQAVRLVFGAASAVAIIAVFNLAHFSQGWVQWGYRFSNDFVPFLLPLVALGAGRADGRPRLIAVALVGVGIAVNAWGVAWGQILGW